MTTVTLSALKASCKAKCDRPAPTPETLGVEIRPGVWELLLVTGSKRHHFECQDCKEPDPLLFSVHDELWNQTELKGIICVSCFEKRIGRKLHFGDLKPSYLTSDAVRYYEWFKEMSKRFPVPEV